MTERSIKNMPRTEKQNEKIRNKRRNTILNESLKLFAYKGYKSVSIDDISNACNAAHSLVYHYFRSKDEIYSEVILLAKDRLKELINISEISQNESPTAKIRTVLDNLLNGLKGKNRLKVASSLILILNTAFEEDVLKLPKEKRPWFMFLKEIERGQELGEIPDGDPKEYNATIIAFLRGVAIASIGIKEEYFVVPSVEIIMKSLKKEEKYV